MKLLTILFLFFFFTQAVAQESNINCKDSADVADLIPYLSPGSIKSIEQVSPEKANEKHIARGYDAPYDSNKPVYEIILSKEVVFVRAYSSALGNRAGAFLADPDEIKGLSPEKLKDVLALDYVPDRLVDVYVPCGIKIRVGTIAARPGINVGGGGFQAQLLERIADDLFKNERVIKSGD